MAGLLGRQGWAYPRTVSLSREPALLCFPQLNARSHARLGCWVQETDNKLGLSGAGPRVPKICCMLAGLAQGRHSRGCCGVWHVVMPLPEPHPFQFPLYPGSSTGTIWEAPEAPSPREPESPDLRPAPLGPRAAQLPGQGWHRDKHVTSVYCSALPSWLALGLGGLGSWSGGPLWPP